MMIKTNSISWNPMEPMNFTAANEDGNFYSYDARKLQEAKCVHQGHPNGVIYEKKDAESQDHLFFLCSVAQILEEPSVEIQNH